MAKLNEVFDATTVPERDDFTPVPPGMYQAMVVASEIKDTKAGGQMIVLELDIQGGEYDGKKLYERLNIKNDNQKAVEIAFRTLAEIVKATGKTSIKDTEELHNKRINIEVRVEPPSAYVDKDGKQQEGKPQNSIKKFLPVSAAVSAPKAQSSPDVATVEQNSEKKVAPWKK